MKEDKKKAVNTDTLKRYVTNAVTEIKETMGEGKVQIGRASCRERV